MRQPDLHVEPPCNPGGYLCVANSLESCGSDIYAVAVSVLGKYLPRNPLESALRTLGCIHCSLVQTVYSV